ncbi:hypothetical protein [Hyphomonas sp. UBA5107]|jgi:hypothetical protein|uniref:hypothetical protein n=1 Tax=Hyphomonas sp. UBA5107 TaxID=1946636 RepID=UPI0025BEAD65|nr:MULTISPECIES: hypothetical protein [unclassified Hyphomonas]|tara:strand:- start:29285 stop:29455 length:171 start_codon:yes stop_codon:yes gene_type:complete
MRAYNNATGADVSEFGTAKMTEPNTPPPKFTVATIIIIDGPEFTAQAQRVEDAGGV